MDNLTLTSQSALSTRELSLLVESIGSRIIQVNRLIEVWEKQADTTALGLAKIYREDIPQLEALKEKLYHAMIN